MFLLSTMIHDNLRTQCRAIINVLVKPGGLADTTCPPASSKDCEIATHLLAGAAVDTRYMRH
jgi:hypothetical protein